MSKEFWLVVLKDKKFTGERIDDLYVFATSASNAESKALKICSKKYPYLKAPYCASVSFVGYMAG